jgi:hypothetical protein
MENNHTHFLKTDDNKIVNERSILWVQKMSECLEVCMKSIGCKENGDTHKICKLNNPESYQKLNKYFE